MTPPKSKPFGTHALTLLTIRLTITVILSVVALVISLATAVHRANKPKPPRITRR